MTNQDYGKQIMMALRAVEQMHSDCSKLLLEFDKKMAPWNSVFGNVATRDLTYNVRADRWMAEGVYRYYSHKSRPNTARAITISFLEAKSAEPLLLQAEINYVGESSDVKEVCDEWDLWSLFFAWLPQEPEYEKLIFLSRPDPKQRIESAKLIAKPLYSIENMDQVYALMDQITSAGNSAVVPGESSGS